MNKRFSIAARIGLVLATVLCAFAWSKARVADVTLDQSFIEPATVLIAPGDTVRWTVVSGTHQLHSDTDSYKSWDSGLLDTPGQTFELPFLYADGAGPFPYHDLGTGLQGAVLVFDTCFATGTLNDSGAPTVADIVAALRIIGGYRPVPENIYRLDLTGDCIVNYADAEALNQWFVFGPGSFPQYPVPTCCFPELQPPSCPVVIPGDINASSTVTSADLLALVHYVYKGGVEPYPCPAAGDLDCSGVVTAADIIYLINYIFKSGLIPCDICTLIPDVWSCP